MPEYQTGTTPRVQNCPESKPCTHTHTRVSVNTKFTADNAYGEIFSGFWHGLCMAGGWHAWVLVNIRPTYHKREGANEKRNDDDHLK